MPPICTLAPSIVRLLRLSFSVDSIPVDGLPSSYLTPPTPSVPCHVTGMPIAHPYTGLNISSHSSRRSRSIAYSVQTISLSASHASVVLNGIARSTPGFSSSIAHLGDNPSVQLPQPAAISQAFVSQQINQDFYVSEHQSDRPQTMTRPRPSALQK